MSISRHARPSRWRRLARSRRLWCMATCPVSEHGGRWHVDTRAGGGRSVAEAGPGGDGVPGGGACIDAGPARAPGDAAPGSRGGLRRAQRPRDPRLLAQVHHAAARRSAAVRLGTLATGERSFRAPITLALLRIFDQGGEACSTKITSRPPRSARNKPVGKSRGKAGAWGRRPQAPHGRMTASYVRPKVRGWALAARPAPLRTLHWGCEAAR